MSDIQEPIFDVAHLGHVELLTPKPEESLWFFRDVLSMQETAREGQSVYLRAWGDYERYSLKLTEAKQAGLGHTAFRSMSPQALERRVKALELGSPHKWGCRGRSPLPEREVSSHPPSPRSGP